MAYVDELKKLLNYFEEFRKNLASTKNEWSAINEQKNMESAEKFKEKMSLMKNELMAKMPSIEKIKVQMLQRSKFLKYKDRLDDLSVNISMLATKYSIASNNSPEQIIKNMPIPKFEQLENNLKNIITIIKEVIKVSR